MMAGHQHERENVMPDFDIWSEDPHKPGYIVSANSPNEAVGRARERWKLPEDLLLISVLRAPDKRTEACFNVGDYLQKTANVIWDNWSYAYQSDDPLDQEAAARLRAAYALISRAYKCMVGLTDLVDAEAQAKRQLEGQTFSTYSDPDQRPELPQTSV
jgi:hypothetical protein